KGARDLLRIAQRCQIDEPDAVVVLGHKRFSCCQSDRRLSDAARPDDRDEPALRQLPKDRIDHLGAADYPRTWSRQVVRTFRWRTPLSRLRLGDLDRRHEAI